MPDYKIIEWNEENYDINKNKFLTDAYNSKKWAFVTDYARLDIIYNNGGIYLDTDVEVLKPFDNLLECKGFMGFENKKFVNTGIGFGAQKNNEIIEKNLKAYDKIDFYDEEGFQNSINCPYITSKVLQDFGFKMNGEFQNLDNFILYPVDYFAPMNYNSGNFIKTKNTYSIHWYSMSWFSKKDYYWHNVSIKLSKFFGNKLATKITLILRFPGEFKEKTKKNGIKRTLKYYLKKIRG